MNYRPYYLHRHSYFPAYQWWTQIAAEKIKRSWNSFDQHGEGSEGDLA